MCLMFGLSIPMPNAIVATMTWSSSLINDLQQVGGSVALAMTRAIQLGGGEQLKKMEQEAFKGLKDTNPKEQII